MGFVWVLFVAVQTGQMGHIEARVFASQKACEAAFSALPHGGWTDARHPPVRWADPDGCSPKKVER